MPGRILVTGATGLIGRRVIEQLLRHGHEVVALDRRLRAGLDLVPDQTRREVTWIEGDTRSSDGLQSAMRRVDSVIHLAAGASFLMYEEAPVEQTAGTIEGFHNVIEAARRSEVECVVYASTSAVYEGNELPYREGMSLRPPDLKALAKKVNEEMADLYSQRYQMRMLGLRPFSVYGEDEMSKRKYANVVSLFAWAMSAGRSPILWGDGTQTRDFIHADDVARAFVMAVESSLRTQVLNVGTGVETSFNDVIALLAEKLGVEPSPLYVATPIDIYAKRLLADVSGCENALGFRSEVSLEDGADRVLVRARAVLDSGEWQGLDAAQSGRGPRRR